MLTKQQRHDIYVAALIAYKEEHASFDVSMIPSCVGLCWAIEKGYNLTLNEDTPPECFPYLSMNAYPEVLKHKPEDIRHPAYWFGLDSQGIAKRISILEQAIKETE